MCRCVDVSEGVRVPRATGQRKERERGRESSPADDDDLLSLWKCCNCPLRSSMPFSWCLVSLGDERSHLHVLMEGDVAVTPFWTDMLAACRGTGKGGEGERGVRAAGKE